MLPPMLVSVLIPSFNYASLIGRAVESVLAQTMQDFEIIIADDGSSDGSWDVLEHWAARRPDRIRITRHPGGRNEGIAATYRRAASMARGEILAFLEADDRWHPECLEKRTAALRRFPSAGTAASRYSLEGDPRGCLYWHFYQETNRLSLRARRIQNTMPLYLLRNPAASFSHFLIRRELFDRIPDPPGRELYFDWWVLAHASALSDFVFLPERLSVWTIHPGSANFGPITYEKLKRLHTFTQTLYDSIETLPLDAPRRKILDKRRRRMLDYLGFFEGRTLKVLLKEPFYGTRFLCHLALNRLLMGRPVENKIAETQPA